MGASEPDQIDEPLDGGFLSGSVLEAPPTDWRHGKRTSSYHKHMKRALSRQAGTGYFPLALVVHTTALTSAVTVDVILTVTRSAGSDSGLRGLVERTTLLL